MFTLTLPTGTKIETKTIDELKLILNSIQPETTPEPVPVIQEPVKPIHTRSAYTTAEKQRIAVILLTEQLKLGRAPGMSEKNITPFIQEMVNIRPEKSVGAAVSEANNWRRVFEGEKHHSDVRQIEGKKKGIQTSKEVIQEVLSALIPHGLQNLPQYEKIVNNFGKRTGGIFQKPRFV